MSLTWHLLLYLLRVAFWCPRSRSQAHHLPALGWGCTGRCRFPFCDPEGEPCQFLPRSRELSREGVSGSGNRPHHSHPSFSVCCQAVPCADAGALFRSLAPMTPGCSMSCVSLCCAQFLCYPELFCYSLPYYQQSFFWPEVFPPGCVSDQHVVSLSGFPPLPLVASFLSMACSLTLKPGPRPRESMAIFPA